MSHQSYGVSWDMFAKHRPVGFGVRRRTKMDMGGFRCMVARKKRTALRIWYSSDRSRKDMSYITRAADHHVYGQVILRRRLTEITWRTCHQSIGHTRMYANVTVHVGIRTTLQTQSSNIVVRAVCVSAAHARTHEAVPITGSIVTKSSRGKPPLGRSPSDDRAAEQAVSDSGYLEYHAPGRNCAMNGNISEVCRRCCKPIGDAAHYWDSPYWYCVPCGEVVIAEQTLRALA